MAKTLTGSTRSKRTPRTAEPAPDDTPKQASRTRTGAASAAPATVEFAVADSGAPLPRLPSMPPFVFTHHPSWWVVLDGRLVPQLRKCPLQPGVEGVEKTKDGRIYMGSLKASLEKRGRTIIPYDAGPGGNYLTSVTTSPNGINQTTAYLSCWESAYPGSEQIGGDLDGYADWCAGLVGDYIDPCPPYIAERLADQKRTTLASYEEKVSRGATNYKMHAEQVRKDLEVLEAYASSDQAPVASASAQVELTDG